MGAAPAQERLPADQSLQSAGGDSGWPDLPAPSGPVAAGWRGGVARRSVSLAGFLARTRRPGAAVHGLHDRAFPAGGAGGGGFDLRAAGGRAAKPPQVARAGGLSAHGAGLGLRSQQPGRRGAEGVGGVALRLADPLSRRAAR